MDRGWTISDIGHRLSWTEVSAFVRASAPDSALQRHWHPERYLRYVLFKPENQILGAIHDRLMAYPFIRAGKVKDIPPGIIESWLDGQEQQKREASKKNLSSSEIRARVAASMR